MYDDPASAPSDRLAIPDYEEDQRHAGAAAQAFLSLAEFGGRVPAAPPWFRHAIVNRPTEAFVEVEGARVEWLCWGEPGAPGLLLMHGFRAHVDWWSFLGPMLGRKFRVAALSFSGAGRSDWREAYSYDLFAREALRVAEAAKLFESEVKPIFVGHSFGGYPTLAAATAAPARLRGIVLVDTLIRTLGELAGRQDVWPDPRPSRIYPDVTAALKRFRLVPDQPCPNLFIADYIARMGLRTVREGDTQGVTWRFDPMVASRMTRRPAYDMLRQLQTPISFIWGAYSGIVSRGRVERILPELPPGTPTIEIEDAGHHVMLDQPVALASILENLVELWPSPLR